MFSTKVYANKKAVTNSVDDQNIDWGGCPTFIPEGCEIGVLHGDPCVLFIAFEELVDAFEVMKTEQ